MSDRDEASLRSMAMEVAASVGKRSAKPPAAKPPAAKPPAGKPPAAKPPAATPPAGKPTPATSLAAPVPPPPTATQMWSLAERLGRAEDLTS